MDYYRISCAWKYVYRKLNSLKNKIGQERFLDIKYEDLVLNPEEELKNICSFMGIPYNPIMTNYDEQIKKEVILNKDKFSTTAKNNLSLLHEGLVTKINTDKIGYWKQGLKQEEANLIWTVCGSLAEKIGYKRDKGFVKQRIKLKNYITFANFTLMRFITKYGYYSSPFIFKYLIKKIKYRKSLKMHILVSKELNQKSFYNN